jgi:hypothetical protein
MPATTKLTWAGVDFSNPAEVEAMRAQEAAEAADRAHKAVAEMQSQGILDKNGRRVRKDLPPDMREDSDCDMSRF